MTAVIFTRHKLTDAQEKEIILSMHDCPIVRMTEEASIAITSRPEADHIVSAIVAHAKDGECLAIFGVMPPPLREAFMRWRTQHMQPKNREVIVFESWNINRAQEGEKPRFEHQEWLLTQVI